MSPSETPQASSSSPPPATALVPIGSYRLEVGSPEGTFALFTAQGEESNASGLAQALNAEAEAEAAKAADLLESPLDEASSVTDCSDRCLRLFNAIAAGEALDPKVISDELDAALALLTRLDRSGRHKDVLRLARDLCALIALLLRWLELVRTLRLALRTAHAIGDRSTEAWALHELGSFHLAAGESKAAAEHLHRALELQQELAGYGRCATRHNLDAAERDSAGREALRKTQRRRRLRFVGAGAAVVLLASGGAALGFRGPHHPKPQGGGGSGGGASSQSQPTPPPAPPPGPPPPPTTTRPNPPPPIVVDKTKPRLMLTAPAGDSFLATDTPIFSGTGGIAAGDLATITLAVFSGSATSGTAVERLTTQRDAANGGFMVTAQPLPTEGPYTVVATQRDGHGNLGTDLVHFTIDQTEPAVSFTSPKDGGLTSVVPTFDGTAGTLRGDEPRITISVFDLTSPSESPVEVLTASAVDGSWTAESTTSLDEGHRYQAVATQSDQAANKGSATVSFGVPVS